VSPQVAFPQRAGRAGIVGARAFSRAPYDGHTLHAALCAAGHNLRGLLRMIAKKGLRAILWLLPAEVRRSVERSLD
jgi:hypothetical protein